MMVNKRNAPAMIFLMLISLVRISIVSKGGVFSASDESRYVQSISAVMNLLRGDIQGFCLYLSSTHCRPGDAIRNLIPSSIQVFVYKTVGIDPLNPDSLFIPSLFNVAISVLISYFIFRISMLIFSSRLLPSFICMTTYSLLANSNIYVRHLLPYDMSLLCFLMALYLILKYHYENQYVINYRIIACSGALCAFGYSVYPGYYFLSLLVFSTFVFLGFKIKNIDDLKKGLRRILLSSAVFICPFIFIFLMYEIIAFAGKAYSYLVTCKALSSTITHGNPEESFSFIYKYLFEVEGETGIIIFFCCLLFLLILLCSPVPLLRQRFNNFLKNKIVIFLFCIGLAGYLLYAIAGVYGIFVFYGRILHQYFPFIIWGFVYFLDALNVGRIYKKAIFCSILTLSIYNFVTFYIEYTSVSYPRDVFHEYGITVDFKEDYYLSVEKYDITKHGLLAAVNPDNSFVRYENETPSFFCYLPPPKNPFRKYATVDTNDLKFINFCEFFPIGRPSPKSSMLRTYYRKLTNRYIKEPEVPCSVQPFKRFTPDNEWKIVYEKPHYSTVKAYHFEGYTIESRNLLKERQYRVIIAKRSGK